MLKKISDFLDDDELSEKKFYTKRTTSQGSGAGDSFDFLALIRSWEEIVGPRLGQHSIPLKNKNGTLFILIDHSAFAQQISFIEEPLKQKIGKVFPELRRKIQNIRFQANPQFFNQKKEQIEKTLIQTKEEKREKAQIFHKFSPEYKKLKSEASHLLEEIDDEELKESLSNIFIQLHHSK